MSAPPGIPTIQPRNAPLVTNTGATVAYTADDVRQFLTNHPFFRTTDGSTPVIAQISLVSASEASALLRGESIGRPPTAMVYYVEVHGNLSMAGVSRPYAPGPYTPRESGLWCSTHKPATS